jgi:hypothetical protein
MTHTQGSIRMLKIKPFSQKEKGPCTAAAEIDDMLAIGVGNRVRNRSQSTTLLAVCPLFAASSDLPGLVKL